MLAIRMQIHLTSCVGPRVILFQRSLKSLVSHVHGLYDSRHRLDRFAGFNQSMFLYKNVNAMIRYGLCNDPLLMTGIPV